ncbi:endolytic transglycosylase MltG [Desulfonatronospira sp.]|uniref:endolytic transglycosylase MltG n=1 Tax=Desulfonatronospira sp. TaxID=1962951 RepID=UPI0025C03270|nr:endolytic transglycosylase MltG [Desulfonatronospira sp.]
MSIKKVLGGLFALALPVIVLGGIYLHHLVHSPQSQESRMEIVRISPGQSFKSIAYQLESQGLIKSGTLMYYWGWIQDKATRVQAGHFQVDTSWSIHQMLEHLSTGREKLKRLQIPEGAPWWDIARLLDKKELASFEEFEAVIHDREFLDRMNIHASNAEGFLYPETYYISPSRDLGAEKLARIMINQFWSSTRDLWGDMPFEEIYELVNLASLIEKETGSAEERPRIAGVFQNRLAGNMLLQCDPTIIYGLGEEFEGRLRRRHLEDRDNAYNTYQYRGFPPTPICSPGRASLEAALNPEEHGYYYFVSRNDGTHHFSKTLQEHNRAVYRYQIMVR